MSNEDVAIGNIASLVMNNVYSSFVVKDTWTGFFKKLNMKIPVSINIGLNHRKTATEHLQKILLHYYHKNDLENFTNLIEQFLERYGPDISITQMDKLNNRFDDLHLKLTKGDEGRFHIIPIPVVTGDIKSDKSSDNIADIEKVKKVTDP
jgi:hypothetical protein